jgi:sortase A
VTLSNIDAILAARRAEDAAPPGVRAETSEPAQDSLGSDAGTSDADAGPIGPPQGVAEGTLDPAEADPESDDEPILLSEEPASLPEEPASRPDELASLPDESGPRGAGQPPTWTQIEPTDPRGAPPIAAPSLTEAVATSGEARNGGDSFGSDGGEDRPIGAPTRPAAALTRAQLRRATAVHAVQASQTGSTPPVREPEGNILEIPWPAVRQNEDADPRHRIPVGAVLTGILGELLITAGVILGLYVVWEVLWSTVEARPMQAQALEAVHERAQYVAPITAAQTGSDTPAFATEYTENFPEIAAGADAVPWMSLHVPRWGYDYDIAIAQGTGKGVIDQGLIGHYPETQNAAELGNFAVAGHRITHGEPFARIQELHNGDELIVETDEYYLVYEMYDQRIVVPTEMSVIWAVPGQAGVPPERRLITLTTCHPRYTSTHRYIVWGELAYWTKKADGPLRALTPPEQRGEGR